MQTILKLHINTYMYQYLNFIVLSTWLPILLQIFHLLHLVENGNSYAYKCAPLNFWTCNNIWIFCFYISMFLFCQHFLTYCKRPLPSHPWFQTIHNLPPPPHSKKENIKMCHVLQFMFILLSEADFKTCVSLTNFCLKAMWIYLPGRLIFFFKLNFSIHLYFRK